MEVLILPFFVGGVVVVLTVAAFVFTVRSGTLDHADRLALLPLRNDAPGRAAADANQDEKGAVK